MMAAGHAPRDGAAVRPGPGAVWLVGAGPGDPELLTLRAVRALASADVILVDDLVDRRVLAHARPAARVVPVGKRGGHASTAQAFIERLMIAEAWAGRCVVRLKGGDPFLFGRGAEEAAAVRRAGIEVHVVPGITSGIAAPMAAGISVTHRAASPGVVFVTGHEQSGGAERIDWTALAASGLTLVIYMGVANAARIARRLIDGGLRADTPAAAVQDATLPTQRSVTGPLAELPDLLVQAGIRAPAILVIGQVVGQSAADELSAIALGARAA